MRGFKVADLPEHMQAEARRQLAGGGVDAASMAVAKVRGSPSVAESPYTGRGAKRGMSKLEQRFQDYLAAQKVHGVVTGYAYELARVTLGVPRAFKRPDFWVRCDGWRIDDADGEFPLVVIEVKPVDRKTGKPYFGPKGRLSVKLAAARLALILVPIYVAWPYMEDWRFERVEVTP